MTFDFNDRVVVVTGASRGLGRSLAESFARRGASIGLLARNEEALAELVDQMRPPTAIPVGCDVSDAAQVAAAFDEIAGRFGRVDVVIANAGGQRTARRAEDLPIDQWQEALDLNLTGAFITARTAYPHLRDSRAGRMIFVSSGAAKLPMSRMASYAAAKAGVEGLMRALSVEWAADGICVNAVSPGFIDTAAAREIPDKIRNRILTRTTLRRPGPVMSFVETVLFLAGEGGEYITGQVLSVDGGYGLG